MKKKFRRFLSLVLAIMCVLNMAFSAYAENGSQFQILDEDGSLFTIKIEETMDSRRTFLYNESGDVVQALYLDKTTGILRNMETGAVVTLSMDMMPQRCNARAAANHEYEYEFCTKGETYSTEEYVTVGEIMQMAGLTASVPAITAAILAMTGVVGWGSALATAKKAANKVISLYKAGKDDTEIKMNFTFKCVEFWESDTSYPGGGFYFLGYQVSKFTWNVV